MDTFEEYMEEVRESARDIIESWGAENAILLAAIIMQESMDKSAGDVASIVLENQIMEVKLTEKSMTH